ncbi:hypothetical protein ACFL6N_01250 [Thermodesulfobacteriota bacterium]
MKKIVLLTAITLLGGIFAAHAQGFEQEGIAAGNVEMGGYASITSYDGDTSMFVGGTIGYFIKDEIEVGGGIFLFDSDYSDSMTLRPFGKYIFHVHPTIVPYAGGAIVYSKVGGGDSSMGLNVNGGCNFFITENTSVGPELNIDFNDGTTITVLGQFKTYF